MPQEPLTVKQSDLNNLMQMIGNFQAGVFRSISLFKKQPKTRQMVIEPLFEIDSKLLFEEAKSVFTEDRVVFEKTWRRIRLNIEDVTFTSGT